MQRVTLTLDDDLLEEVDRFIEKRGYANRSEAFRDMVRAGLQHAQTDTPKRSKTCVAALVYVYERDVRELPKRLSEVRANHHDLTISTIGVDLDHTSCMEVALLKGPTAEIRHLGTHIMAERGVRYGRLVEVPVDVTREAHQHGHGHTHAHDHFKVRQGS